MKKSFLLFCLSLITFSNAYASLEDNSIQLELDSQKVKTLSTDLNLKSFESCQNMEDVMWNYIKEYWKNNKQNYRYPLMVDDVMYSNMEKSEEVTSSDIPMGDSNDFSQTNNQVSWVDESDIIKTDWKYIYYFNDSDNYIYIVSANDKKVLKKISIPSNLYNPVMYLWWDKLTIVSSWYYDYDYSSKWYYINRNDKTYVIVFNVSNIESPKLEKMYITDWSLSQSRKIWDYVYVISNNYFSIPYYNFKTEEDIDFSISNIMPQKIDISKTNVKEKQNLKIKWSVSPYNISSWNVADCSKINYVLPDEETIKQYDFNPSYNVISIIDTKNTSKKVESSVIVWSNSQIYMSLDNLYMTSYMYQSYDFACPMNAKCFAPWFSRGSNTLLHKLNVSWMKVTYDNSTIIPWTPLTQWSMDEYKNDFRILTQTNSWESGENESHTDLYILDKNLSLKWSLKNLWAWEQFKWSRYIGDKLFLVTFEQTDPLFVIDVADSTSPKILWELKIPWYSTYLHPYDANHLIGIGYDTKENEWGWIVNSGLKIDLYEINYDKKCGDSNLTSDEKTKCDNWDYKWIIVKQKFTKTLGANWSYSEALDNPRMFMWKASDKKLFLPATLYYNNNVDLYRYTDYFNWVVTLTIDKDFWIKEDYRVTHIDTTWLEDERKKECSVYTKQTTQNSCVKLLNWEEYCENKVYNYVPTYCYADSKIWEYLASVSWNYYNNFIKRAIWIWDNSYNISNNFISSNNITTWKEVFKLQLK